MDQNKPKKPPVEWLKCVKLTKDTPQGPIKIKIKYDTSMSMEEARIKYFNTLRKMLSEIKDKADSCNCSEIVGIFDKYDVFFMDTDSFPNVNLQEPDA